MIVTDDGAGHTQTSLKTLRGFLLCHADFEPIQVSICFDMDFGFEAYGTITHHPHGSKLEYEAVHILLSGFSTGGEGFSGLVEALRLLSMAAGKSLPTSEELQKIRASSSVIVDVRSPEKLELKNCNNTPKLRAEAAIYRQKSAASEVAAKLLEYGIDTPYADTDTISFVYSDDAMAALLKIANTELGNDVGMLAYGIAASYKTGKQKTHIRLPWLGDE